MARLWPPGVKPPECAGCDREYTGLGFVPGDGPADARLLLIGEQPGPVERDKGSPFRGPSGDIVNRALGDRDAVFVTNVRKCEGIGDYEPSDVRRRSIAHCVAAYLEKEIAALTQVRSVLAIGADAALVVAGVDGIGSAHGAVFTREEAEACSTASQETP